MTYKKGDKLVCTQPKSIISPEFDLPHETVFTVARDGYGLGGVHLEGYPKSFSPNRFRLAGVGEIATAARLAPEEGAGANALAAQVGGAHYKDCAIQPVEFVHANGLPFIEGSVVKYVSRWRRKGGVEDLKKAKHFLDLLIELEARAA